MLAALAGRALPAVLRALPELATATIWQRLADEHDATVAYYTLRIYVVSRRTATKAAAGPPPAGPGSMTKPGPETSPGQLR